MNNIKNLFTLYKSYSGEIKLLKIIVLVIVNTWLLIIFWKILLIDNVFIGNHIALTKMQTVIQPLLTTLGLDILSTDVIKMLIITIVILGANIMLLNLKSMMIIIITLGITKYGYKSYTNYLINSKSNTNYFNLINSEVEKQNVLTKAAEQVPLINAETVSGGSNWIMWIGLGVALIVCFGLLIWSLKSSTGPNDHTVDVVDVESINILNSKIVDNINTLNTKIAYIDEKVTTQVNYIVAVNDNNTKMFKEVNHKIDINVDLTNDKIKGIEEQVNSLDLQIKELNIINMQNIENIENVKTFADKTLLSSKEALQEALQSNTATESLIVSVLNLMDKFNAVSDRVTAIEGRVGVDSVDYTTNQDQAQITLKLIENTKPNND